MPNAALCLICGTKLSVTKKNDKTVLTCPVDGELKCLLTYDPLALAKHCDDLGIDDLEAGAKITQLTAESSFQEDVFQEKKAELRSKFEKLIAEKWAPLANSEVPN